MRYGNNIDVQVDISDYGNGSSDNSNNGDGWDQWQWLWQVVESSGGSDSREGSND